MISFDSLVGRSVFDDCVPTPLVYIDRAILDRNIQHMAEEARRSGCSLRPHVKTHKLAEIARAQLEAGAIGLTVAKLSEAEAFLSAGIAASFMVAQPYVGRGKIVRHLDLAERTEFIACIDDLELARTMAAEAAGRGTEIDLVLIVDTGYGRFGAVPASVPELAAQMARLPGVRFRGIRSHSGHAYGARDHVRRAAIAAADATAMSNLAARIRRRGVSCEIVSVGSTPGTAGLAGLVAWEGISEWRPGNYVFFDRMQVSLGVASLEECALRVVVSVVSAGDARAVVDAGKKLLTSTLDPGSTGHGHVVDCPEASIHTVSEECGWISASSRGFRVGERLMIVPNHACELTNLAEVVACGRDGVIEAVWEPVSRAKVW